MKFFIYKVLHFTEEAWCDMHALELFNKGKYKIDYTISPVPIDEEKLKVEMDYYNEFNTDKYCKTDEAVKLYNSIKELQGKTIVDIDI